MIRLFSRLAHISTNDICGVNRPFCGVPWLGKVLSVRSHLISVETPRVGEGAVMVIFFGFSDRWETRASNLDIGTRSEFRDFSLTGLHGTSF
jgi:hypothetical protein